MIPISNALAFALIALVVGFVSGLAVSVTSPVVATAWQQYRTSIEARKGVRMALRKLDIAINKAVEC